MSIKIEHRIGIRAPADTIWELIYDVASWPEWNPLYPRAEGQVRIGGKLALVHGLPMPGPSVIEPTVLDWVPREQLHWRRTLASGFIKTIRYVEIETLTESGCIVSNGELFEGSLVPYVLRGKGGTIRRAFAAMNEALKETAEARWRAGAASTTSEP